MLHSTPNPVSAVHCVWPESGMIHARSQTGVSTLVRCGRLLLSTTPLDVSVHPMTGGQWQQRTLQLPRGQYDLNRLRGWQLATTLETRELWHPSGWKQAAVRALTDHLDRAQHLPGSLRRREDLLLLLASVQIALEQQPDLSVSALADICCLSASRFHRVYTCAYGDTPRQAGNRFRLLHAMNLLAFTRLYTIEISQLCGYACRASLCRVISSELDMTPSEFRRAVREDAGVLWTTWQSLCDPGRNTGLRPSTACHRQVSRRLLPPSATPR